MHKSILAIVLLLATSAAHAQNQYYVATNGSGTACSVGVPCGTIQQGQTTASVGGSGAVVNVANGTYSQGSQLTLSKSGNSSSAFLTYRCATVRGCTISSSATGNTAIVQVSGNFVKMIGFNLTDTNGAVPNINLGLYITGHDVWFTQGSVHDMQPNCSQAGGGGINIATGAGSGDVFDSNAIYNIGNTNSACNSANTVHGINLESNGPSTARVTNNIVHHVKGGWCIQEQAASVGSAGTVIANNLLYACGNGGIVLNEAGGTIDYNTVINNHILVNGTSQSKFGIDEYHVSGTHNKYANNNVYGNSGGDYHFQTGSQSGGISINPASNTTFVNWQSSGSGDYHLRAGSQAVGGGTISCAAGISNCASTVDFDGTAMSSPPAIGPYTFGTASPPGAPTSLTATPH